MSSLSGRFLDLRIDDRTIDLYNEYVDSRQVPLSLTRQELDAFNRFWQAIPPEDREILDKLLSSVEQYQTAADKFGYPLPYQTYLLALLLGEHKEVQRLRRLLEGQRR